MLKILVECRENLDKIYRCRGINGLFEIFLIVFSMILHKQNLQHMLQMKIFFVIYLLNF